MVAPMQPAPVEHSRRRRIATTVGISVAVIAIYAASLLGYHLLSGSARPLPPANYGTTDDTVVVVSLIALHTVDNRLDVEVAVLPEDDYMDTRLDVVNTDIAVRLYPPNQQGDLQ